MTYPKIDKPTVPGWYWARFHAERLAPFGVRHRNVRLHSLDLATR